MLTRSMGPMQPSAPWTSILLEKHLLGLLVNVALLPIALRVTRFNICVVQALFTEVVVIGSCLGHRYYSFRDQRRRDSDDPAVYASTVVPKD
jgi:hypothetical protein